MEDVVISVRGIGKEYRLGFLHGDDTLRDRIANLTKAALRAGKRLVKGEIPTTSAPSKKFWALRDVSFDVEKGEVVGIIGSNGAGKSTLLKILSQVTAPTVGEIRITGRVSSLLEVGTGFHPELSGRENIFMNGAILGMSLAEIKRKLDEIVAFAGVEKFLDTPVKRYSSGMYVRLAFAVAAHLEPEILIVDEVLAVGDAAFQKKCLARMKKVAKGGRTILFVSHNMSAVNQLCTRAIWLDKGQIAETGDTGSVITSYLQSGESRCEAGIYTFEEDIARASQLLESRLINARGELTKIFSCDEAVTFELTYKVYRQLPHLYGCFQVSTEDGTVVLLSYSHDMDVNPLETLPVGTHKIALAIPPRTLGHGDYRVTFSTGSGMVGTVVIDDPGVIGTFRLEDNATRSGNRRLGYLSTLLDWKVREQ